MTAAETVGLWRGVETDIANGVLVEHTVPLVDLFRAAEALVQLHTAETGARTLDILHVAAAQALGVTDLVTFDQRQQALASRLGLRLATI